VRRSGTISRPLRLHRFTALSLSARDCLFCPLAGFSLEYLCTQTNCRASSPRFKPPAPLLFSNPRLLPADLVLHQLTNHRFTHTDGFVHQHQQNSSQDNTGSKSPFRHRLQPSSQFNTYHPSISTLPLHPTFEMAFLRITAAARPAIRTSATRTVAPRIIAARMGVRNYSDAHEESFEEFTAR